MALLKQIKNLKSQSGQSLVELLVSMGLLAILLPALLTGLVASREGKPQTRNRTTATILLQEAEEAVRSSRESSWDNVVVPEIYHPVVSGSSYTLELGPEIIGDFSRQVMISDVRRDGGGAISSVGSVDPSTKRVEVEVSWEKPVQSSVSTVFYLTRYVSNDVLNQTTQQDFDLGEMVRTETQNLTDGEVILAKGSGGSWADAQPQDTYNVTGSAVAECVYVLGDYAFVAVNDRNTTSLLVLDVSDPTDVTPVSTLNLSDDVSEITGDGDYLYLSTFANSEEFMVIDVSDIQNPEKVASLNLNQNADALSIFLEGNFVYLGRDSRGNAPELYLIDVTNPLSPQLRSGVEINNNVNDIYVSGDYAYLATNDVSNEIRIINVSNKSSPSQAATYNMAVSTEAKGVYYVAPYVYVVTKQNGGVDPEFFVLNVSNLQNITLVGSYIYNINLTSVSVIDNYAVLTAQDTTAVHVLDLSQLPTISEYGTYSITGSGLYSHLENDLLYIITTDSSAELKIVKGGTGGIYVTSGTFVSPPFDSQGESSFNFLDFNSDEPSGTNVKYQVAINNDNLTWFFFGPDGTASTYFETGSGVPFEKSSGRYFKAMFYLTSNGNVTPTLYDFSVNYAP